MLVCEYRRVPSSLTQIIIEMFLFLSNRLTDTLAKIYFIGDASF